MNILHVTLAALHLESMKRFYVDFLGLPLEAEGTDWFRTRVGKTRLTFLESPEETYYHFAMRVQQSVFDAMRARIDAEIGLMADDDGDTLFFATDWQQSHFYFADPDRNVLEILGASQAGDDNGWVSISEMGIPVPDVPSFRNRLIVSIPSTYPIQREDFQFHGDENGVFVIVRTGRDWFPTSRPAAFHPISVEVEGEAADVLTYVDVPGLSIRTIPTR